MGPQISCNNHKLSSLANKSNYTYVQARKIISYRVINGDLEHASILWRNLLKNHLMGLTIPELCSYRCLQQYTVCMFYCQHCWITSACSHSLLWRQLRILTCGLSLNANYEDWICRYWKCTIQKLIEQNIAEV